MFIPDLDPELDLDFFTHPGSRIPDPEVKRHRILDPEPGHGVVSVSGSATLGSTPPKGIHWRISFEM
jgi:hypothetical protein